MTKETIKILVVVGARPNFIKIAPLFNEFKKCRKIKPVLVHTGQHYDYEMSQVFFQDLKIPKPDYNLKVGYGSQAWQTAKIMEKLEPVFVKEKPRAAVVLGDVNSTLAGALTAAKINCPVVHIEAGLRSFDKKMPEEINRLLTDHISDLLFCPTKTAISNLKKEGIKKGVFNVGDIMYDAFLSGLEVARRKSKILEELNLTPKKYLLLTIHRLQNAESPENLKKILGAISESGEKTIFLVHPQTKKNLKKFGLKKFPNISFQKPKRYLDMLLLEKNAKKIVTDSGGVQKESYWLGVPCITLRERTEWIETVESGWNVLVGSEKEKIKDAIENFMPKSRRRNYFGKGKAAQKIIKILLPFCGGLITTKI